MRIVSVVVQAAILAVILALSFSDSELVSVQVWLAFAAAFIGINLLIRILSVAEVEPAQIAIAWTWRFRRRHHRRQVDRRPHELRSMEGMVLSAMENQRVHAIRLRPRLSALADHFMPIRQGIDPGSDPARAKALLGDVAWLVDPNMSDRIPTVHELDKFLDIILDEENRSARSDQSGNN